MILQKNHHSHAAVQSDNDVSETVWSPEQFSQSQYAMQSEKVKHGLRA